MGSLFTSDKVKTESAPPPRLRRGMLESESDYCHLNEDSGNSKRKGDSEDLLSSDMTLKELQERSRKKKKLQESASREQTTSTGSFGDMKQDDASAQIKEEEFDLEIPLSVWKRKVSNKAKRRKQVWPSSEPGVSVTDRVLSGSEDQLSTINNKHESPNIDIGNTKPEHSYFPTAACRVANGSTLGSLPINDIGAMDSSILVSANHVANRIRGNNLEETTPASQDLGSNMLENHKGYTLQPHVSCHMNSENTNDFVNLVDPDTFQPKELNGGDPKCGNTNGEDTATFRGSVIENIQSLHMSSTDPLPYFNPQNDAGSVMEYSPPAEDISNFTTDGPIYASADEGLDCLSNVFPIPSNGFTAIEVFDSRREPRIYCTPRRLLSTRKEKLRQAMDTQEHCDNMGNPRSDLEGSKIRDSQVGEKPRKNVNLSPQAVPKGILKPTHFSVLGTPPDQTESSSVPARVQKAVAFSQRQMQDIESLAMKLMKELKSMKGIVEESLHSRECSSTPAYTADEMSSAVQNAAEVEETTKKWLSMMAKDCSRFCKIMRSTGKTRTASPGSVERKKIVFADEAGGSLCHVKILENTGDSASAPESESAAN